jgi:type IV secretory pathway TrbD component
MNPRFDHIEGYVAPIHRALWERIQTGGVPRLWAAVWLVACAYTALLLLTVCGARWALLPAVAWALGHGALMLLTQWDVHWDDMAVAHLLRRYRAFYEAG